MSPVTASTIGSFIREQREQAKISMRQLAQAAGVSNPYLSQVERGLRRPSADILQQIAKGLRISAEALYVQAGILDDRPADTSVPDAIMTDPEITERQKQMLIEIYESFRKEVRADAEARAAASAELEPVPDPAASAEPDATEHALTEAAPAEHALTEAALAGHALAGQALTEAAQPPGWPEPPDQRAVSDTEMHGEPGTGWPGSSDRFPPVIGTAAESGQGWPVPADQVSAHTSTR